MTEFEGRTDLAQAESFGSASTSAESSVLGPMAEKTSSSFVSSVEHIFRHMRNRKVAIVKALTVDFDKFFEECDPGKDNLCLYGLGNGKWVVGLPEDNVPAEFPEPVVGINFARDGMPRNNWLKFIALHSDAWLLGLAAFYSSLLHGSERKRLFCMLSDLPTVYEIITGKADVTDCGIWAPDRSNESRLHFTRRKRFRFNSDDYEETVMSNESKSG